VIILRDRHADKEKHTHGSQRRTKATF
jgi:hypothetical protein